MTEGGIVLVANAAGVPGAAGRFTQALAELGFTTREPVNAAGSDEELEVSRIYFRAEAREVALSVSSLMGDVPMLPMPTPPPIVDALAALADANVLVMLGADRAEEPLPERG